MRVTVLCVVLFLCAAGCAATASLHAKPETVCAGRAVRLSWDGSDSGEITAEPADAALGDVPASGVKTVRPKATTTYSFRVSSLLSSATSDSTVKVLAVPEKPATIRANLFEDEGAGCAPGRRWATARIAPGEFDPRLRVNLVWSADGLVHRVEHAGRSADVGLDAPSDALRDLPIAGAWRIETPNLPGERCGHAAGPAELAVNVSFVCAD